MLFPRATSQVAACRHLATAARVKYPAALQRCKFDTPLLAAGSLIGEYLADCKERNVESELTYKGTFSVKISPELHRNIAAYAMEHGKRLNVAVEEAIGNMVRV